jgi:hypothetical protein
LATLADRYDLNQTDAAELRSLLVDYATRVAMVLSDGSELAWAVLGQLRERFADLAEAAVTASEARGLIERGALQASRGGRLGDWEGLASWFDPSNGRAARFAMRLIQALPGMHANLRRLHTSAGAATSRARALTFAAAGVAGPNEVVAGLPGQWGIGEPARRPSFFHRRLRLFFPHNWPVPTVAPRCHLVLVHSGAHPCHRASAHPSR